MDDIVRISSSAPWEPIFGYLRAVRAGEWVAVSGSTGLDENGQLVGRRQSTCRRARQSAISRRRCSGWVSGWSTSCARGST